MALFLYFNKKNRCTSEVQSRATVTWTMFKTCCQHFIYLYILHTSLFYTYLPTFKTDKYNFELLFSRTKIYTLFIDRVGILKKYAYGPDRTRTDQIRVCSGTYTLLGIVACKNKLNQ